jgi:hypothetical protein
VAAGEPTGMCLIRCASLPADEGTCRTPPWSGRRAGTSSFNRALWSHPRSPPPRRQSYAVTTTATAPDAQCGPAGAARTGARPDPVTRPGRTAHHRHRAGRLVRTGRRRSDGRTARSCDPPRADRTPPPPRRTPSADRAAPPAPFLFGDGAGGSLTGRVASLRATRGPHTGTPATKRMPQHQHLPDRHQCRAAAGVRPGVTALPLADRQGRSWAVGGR